MRPLISFPRYHCLQCDSKSLIYDIDKQQYRCTDCGLNIKEKLINSIINCFIDKKNDVLYAPVFIEGECIACGHKGSLCFCRKNNWTDSINLCCDKCKIKLEMSDLLETNCIRYKTILINQCWAK